MAILINKPPTNLNLGGLIKIKMKDRLKSWKTTAVGIIALIGLSYKAYTSGGFEVSDFLILAAGVGFIGAKDKLKVSNTIDPNREYPDERG